VHICPSYGEKLVAPFSFGRGVQGVNSYHLSLQRQINRPKKSTCLVESTFCIIGIAYAAVFPDPVRARARMSLPCNANGIVFSCIGSGFCQPSLATAYTAKDT